MNTQLPAWLERPTARPFMNTQLPAWLDTLSTWRTPLFCIDESSLRRRYRPRPIGQRMRQALKTDTYSFTRPLILVTELDTLTFLEEKMEGIVLEGEMPSALEALTEERAATLTRRSPMDERFLPLPAMTYLESFSLAVAAYDLRDR